MKSLQLKTLVMNPTSYLKSAFSLIALLLMIGCSEGGEAINESLVTAEETEADLVTGQFIDGPVSGLTYTCSSGRTGTTNSNGEFTCKKGDSVTFSVGNVILGSAIADSVITPVTLHPGNPEASTNIAQLLQTLDSDGDLTTFVIDEAKATSLDASLDVTSPSFDAEAEAMLLGEPLIDASSALSHMNESIASLPTVDVPISADENLTEPTSIIAEPTSIVTEPPSIVTEPTPVVIEPTPVVSDPTPVVSDPTPVVTVPTPVVTDPTPVVTDPNVEPIPVAPVIAICEIGPAMQQGQIKDSISGAGLVDVTVTIAGCSTKTDANGFYTLNNIVVNDKAVVNFEKEGYLLGSTKIQIKELSGDNTTSPNYLEYAIDTYDFQWSYDSQTRAVGGHIDIPASTYTDTAGDLYSGMVSASLELLDVTTDEGKRVFPGSFEGQNKNGEMQQFVSHGLISLSFKDTNGNTLNLAEGTIATLTFDAVASMDGTNIIPLWYYDYLQGLWIEEGYAELQANGTYRGEISHPGTWSLNQPIENAPGIYRGRIIYTDGTPAQDVRIHAVGNNWIATDLSTDANGIFEIKVIPGNIFQLTAYNYKDKYEAKHNTTISAIASGEIVADRM